jgi:hypothetical protein
MFRRATTTTAILRLMFVGSAFSCSHAEFDGRVYSAKDVAFRIGPIPSSWQKVEVDGARLAYEDPDSGTILSVSARCGRDADDVPLEALTKHLFIQFTEREQVEQKRFSLDGREALQTTLRAKLDGVPRRFRVVVLKKDGCVYDLSEIATSRSTARSDAVFEQVVVGFSTQRQ